MTEYLSPGGYIEEAPSGARTIEGVGTATAGFVGLTERGPLRVQLVASWNDFQRWYGGPIDASFLPLAARGFFDNGGKRLYVARVAGSDAVAARAVLPGAPKSEPGEAESVFDATAVGPGAWGNNISITVSDASAPERDWYRIRVSYHRDGVRSEKPDLEEDFDNLSGSGEARNYAPEVVNAQSRLIRIGWTGANGSKPVSTRPANAAATSLAGGCEGTGVSAADFAGNDAPAPEDRTGLAGLAVIKEVSIVSIPDDHNPGIAGSGQIQDLVIGHCERLRDRFAILNRDEDEGEVRAIRNERESSFAAVYHPWIRVALPGGENTRLMPPSGHVAGIYARADIQRGVHKAPANEAVLGIVERDLAPGIAPLRFHFNGVQQEVLNASGINVIRDFRQQRRGIRVWGARTMSRETEFKYVNVRRYLLFLEQSISEGTRWIVFEPNDEPLWVSVRSAISAFLIGQWQAGALIGARMPEAFFVRCDRTTMTQNDIDNGRLICLIGVAPVKPAEFIIFRISQKTAEADS